MTGEATESALLERDGGRAFVRIMRPDRREITAGARTAMKVSLHARVVIIDCEAVAGFNGANKTFQ